MQDLAGAWTPKKLDYELGEGRRLLVPKRIPFTDYHPLKPILVTEVSDLKSYGLKRKGDVRSNKSSSSGKMSERSEFVDPLSVLAVSDPLSTMSAGAPETRKESPKKRGSSLTEDPAYPEDLKSWNARKFEILNEYTFDEKLSAQMASLVRSGEKNAGRGARNLPTSELLRNKLKKLNDIVEGNFSESKVTRQQLLIEKMYEYKTSLKSSWEANQKVNALKTAIQCAKMLGNLSVLHYYPSKFVLIADVLEIFGRLVFERILSMCGGMTAANIDPAKVPENAKEICLNWMMKVSSIRELLPRILIEASILPCFSFLKREECNSTLVRLTNMAKGVGDPLVSLYVRAYLCIVGMKYAPKFRGYLVTNYYQFIETYKQIHTTCVQNEIASQKIDMSSYLSLYVPGLEWIISCIACKATENTLSDVMDKCARTGNSLMILNCILLSFKAELIVPKALDLCSVVSKSNDKQFSKAVVLSALGRAVVASTPTGKDKKSLLTEAWKYLSVIQDPAEYMSCVVPWTEYAAKNCKKREVNAILGDILKHLTPDRAFQKYYQELLSVLKGVLSHMTDFSEVFAMDKFLAYLDMFQKEDAKLRMCDLLVEVFCNVPAESTSDPLVINGMMYVCQAIHDSVTSLTPESHIKSASMSISSVVQKIVFGRDFEQQLNFYVECRGSFYKLDSVLANLVHLVNNLSTTATKIVKHRHTAKTSAFVRACAAYSFITIPSVSNIETRLQLYLVSGQAALLNHCVTQADAMFCAAVGQIKDLCFSGDEGKGFSQDALLSYIFNFLSSLLTVPDHPEQGILYLLRGLLNVVSSENTNSKFPVEVKMRIYIKVLSLLSAYSQDKYIYQVDYVDSNEHLYSSDPKFNAEITKVSTGLLSQIFAFLQAVSQYKATEQASIAIELLSAIIAHGDTSVTGMQDLTINIWNKALQTRADTEILKKLLRSMKTNPVNSKIAEGLSIHGKAAKV